MRNLRGQGKYILSNRRREDVSKMSANKKRKRPAKKVAIDDVLDCTLRCKEFPYGCIDCEKEE